MYHHYEGKHSLALDAITVLADTARGQAEAVLTGPGTALERVLGYLHMQRDALRGCPVGRLTQDPEVVADEELRQPVQRHLSWLVDQVTALLAAARRDGDLPLGTGPATTAETVVATVQGGYVLARAGGDPAAQARAIDGLVDLLTRKAS